MKATTSDAGTPDTIVLEGRLTADTVGPAWDSAIRTLESRPREPVIVEASRLEIVDDVGLAFLFDLARRKRTEQARVEFRGLAPRYTRLIEDLDPEAFARAIPRRRQPGSLELVGRYVAGHFAYLRELVIFIGEAAARLFDLFRGRGQLNRADVLDIATEAGANAVPIVVLVGFLMGVIVAFQTGLVARQFGAIIFVPNGVGVAMLREMGPLMTAIVFAGRTGAAFAAEIGTQKVNEEVNALLTFGLSPVAFLVLPRLLASALVLPLLCVVADLAGLVGGGLVLTLFDMSFTQYTFKLLSSVDAADFLIGLLKALLFGFTIAAVGCHRGLATGAGAISVGLSTTSAVVTSIVLVIVIDGLFAVATR